MRSSAIGACLLLLVLECTASGNDNLSTPASMDAKTANATLTTADVNERTSPPRDVNTPANTAPGVGNATRGNGTTAVTTTVTSGVNNISPSRPGATNRTTTRSTNTTSSTANTTTTTTVSGSHALNSTYGPEQPTTGGTAALLGLPNAVLGSLLFLALCNQ